MVAEKQQMEQMPKGSVLKQLEWATQKSQIENQQRKKNKIQRIGDLDYEKADL